MESLYHLTNEFLELMEYADSTDPEEEQIFLDTLDGLMGCIDKKVDSYVCVMDHMSAHKDLLNKEIDRLSGMVKALENNEKRMKVALQMAMTAMNKRKIETDYHKISIAKNGGKMPMVITGDVPDNFMKVIYEPDKDKIRDALENGEALDFAYLEERGEHLIIK